MVPAQSYLITLFALVQNQIWFVEGIPYWLNLMSTYGPCILLDPAICLWKKSDFISPRNAKNEWELHLMSTVVSSYYCLILWFAYEQDQTSIILRLHNEWNLMSRQPLHIIWYSDSHMNKINTSLILGIQ